MNLIQVLLGYYFHLRMNDRNNMDQTNKTHKTENKHLFIYGLLFFILVALGGISLLRFQDIESRYAKINDSGLIIVSHLSDVEKYWQQTITELGRYEHTHDLGHYQNAINNLNQAREALDLSQQANVDLQLAGLNEITDNLNEYKQQLMRLDAALGSVSADLITMDIEDKKFKTLCNVYLSKQYTKAKKNITEGEKKEILTHRIIKFELMHNVSIASNEISKATWRSFAEDNPAYIQNVMPLFDLIKSNIEQIRPMTTKAYDIQTLDTLKMAAVSYSNAVANLHKNWMNVRDVSSVKTSELIASRHQVLIKDQLLSTLSESRTALNSIKAEFFYLWLAMVVVFGVVMGMSLYRSAKTKLLVN